MSRTEHKVLCWGRWKNLIHKHLVIMLKYNKTRVVDSTRWQVRDRKIDYNSSQARHKYIKMNDNTSSTCRKVTFKRHKCGPNGARGKAEESYKSYKSFKSQLQKKDRWYCLKYTVSVKTSSINCSHQRKKNRKEKKRLKKTQLISW